MPVWPRVCCLYTLCWDERVGYAVEPRVCCLYTQFDPFISGTYIHVDNVAAKQCYIAFNYDINCLATVTIVHSGTLYLWTIATGHPHITYTCHYTDSQWEVNAFVSKPAYLLTCSLPARYPVCIMCAACRVVCLVALVCVYVCLYVDKKVGVCWPNTRRSLIKTYHSQLMQIAVCTKWVRIVIATLLHMYVEMICNCSVTAVLRAVLLSSDQYLHVS